MKKFAFTITFILIASVALAANHPAVCRVKAPESNGMCSYGSGSCVYSKDGYSLIITNHHVIEDLGRNKQITVIFPSETKKAKLIGFDETYDLAALVVKGELPVLKMASKKPIKGEVIILIGYASSEYREARGKVNGFYTPREGLPLHWFSVDHPSRSGDSGGPMLNSKGELIGVLFGSNSKETIGTNSFKVELFISTLPRGM